MSFAVAMDSLSVLTRPVEELAEATHSSTTQMSNKVPLPQSANPVRLLSKVGRPHWLSLATTNCVLDMIFRHYDCLIGMARPRFISTR